MSQEYRVSKQLLASMSQEYRVSKQSGLQSK